MAKNEQFRAIMRESREGKSLRTILLNPGTNIDGSSNTVGNINASGAIQLTIHDVIPHPARGSRPAQGSGYRHRASRATRYGPSASTTWEMEEKGEVQACSEQTLTSPTSRPHLTV